MSQRHHSIRPSLEQLERRDTPSNFTVQFSAVTHTLIVTGDAANNNLTVQADAGDSTRFVLSSATDTFNNAAGPLPSQSGVFNILIALGDGNDTVNFNNVPVPIDLKGNLTIKGGNGANSVTATDMKIGKNLSITNGTNTSGTDSLSLANPNIGGRLMINNGAGNTLTSLFRSSAGSSTIGGSVSITNGTGYDSNRLVDINYGGNITIRNGHGDASGNTNYTTIFNELNTAARSVIRGNVSVSNLDGNVASYDGIWDMEILGNVTFNHGSGSVVTYFDGYVTNLPVVIRGSLTMLGSGVNTVSVGLQYKHTGLLVGRKLTFITGGGAETLALNKLQVQGNTFVSLGNGNNTVTIDDSEFSGTFRLFTGTGTDTVNLDTTAGSGAPTVFMRPVFMFQGAGNDSLVRSGSTDANQLLVILARFIVHHGDDPGDSTTSTLGHELFPFANSIEYVI